MKKFLSFFISIIILMCTLSTICFGKNIDVSDTTLDANEQNNKVVYLTFDDGPGGKITSEVLDVLKKEDVKATFFVVGELVEANPDIIKRMYEEGHSIGLHTYSHKKSIYNNEENFLAENLKTKQLVYDLTGYEATILRFPFGCNNSYYKLTDSMLNKLHENNINIYDWNVDSTDGMNPKLEPYKIAAKAKSDKEMAMVLMHTGYANKNSATALPLVIQYYKDHGYEFKTITHDTPELYKVKSK